MARFAPFIAPQLKVARANAHINNLSATLRQFLASNPYEIVLHRDEGTGENTLCCNVKQLMDPAAPLIIGDVLHNLRSGLDILANDILFLKGDRSQNAIFPIYNDAKTFADTVKKRIDRKGTFGDVVAALERYQPYISGDRSLRNLHDLNIADKHKLIIPTVSLINLQHISTNVGTGTLGSISIGQLTAELAHEGINDLGFTWATRTPPDLTCDTKPTTRITLRHSGVPDLSNQEVVPTLINLSQKVSRVISELVDSFGGKA